MLVALSPVWAGCFLTTIDPNMFRFTLTLNLADSRVGRNGQHNGTVIAATIVTAQGSATGVSSHDLGSCPCRGFRMRMVIPPLLIVVVVFAKALRAARAILGPRWEQGTKP